MSDEVMPSVSPSEYQLPPTIFDPATCVRKGLCPVTQIRNQDEHLESHSLYFELHGTGPGKVVFIMGLNSSSASWLPQVKHFARKPEYSVLVFDNRGVGNSGTPRGPYTTSGMASDVVVLLDYVGWKEPRQIHVVGVSLGGMIAQELAKKIPERIVSLTLVVTKPGRRQWFELAPLAGIKGLAKSMMISDPEQKIPIVLNMLFPKEWLDSKREGDPEGRTNWELEFEAYRERIRFTRPQSFLGSISQMAAAITHYVSPDELRKISSSIPKVTIVTGDTDNLIDPRNSHILKEHMPEAELIVRQGAGHAVAIQYKEWFNELLERVFKEGREKAQQQ
ncbi:alpha/beta-hydrolase [Trametes coccinea BRFM310]|uniref:Alpha/beta-hydrolase n=1 Tax=Trametes coccinea (strain BRFM310) TaxID=1353009 RepID=A0A1Y2IM39_TRAC3|nr:alpha/beta-hydrolase [Trametes coccinea BRFM310]